MYKKILTRLMVYMYITIPEEFNQFFINIDEKYHKTYVIIYEVKNTLREFEQGNHETIKNILF